MKCVEGGFSCGFMVFGTEIEKLLKKLLHKLGKLANFNIFASSPHFAAFSHKTKMRIQPKTKFTNFLLLKLYKFLK